MKKQPLFLLTFMMSTLIGCKKFVQVDMPATQLQAQAVFKSDANATAAMLAIYSAMETDGMAYNMILYTGLSADELTNYALDAASVDLATNNLNATTAITSNLWTRFYRYIYQANDILEQLNVASNISLPVSRQLQGESKFVRAFCHFYLLQLFGDIPMVSSTDFRINAVLPRSSTSEVYEFIEADLKDAINLLAANYVGANNQPSVERVRPNRATARALLARVYLYRQKWADAETSATSVLSDPAYALLPDMSTVFLKNSAEAIWQWQSVVPRFNTYPGGVLILTTTPQTSALDTNFVKSFQAMDNRKTAWIGNVVVGGNTYYFPAKYKVRQNAATITEYTMIFRISEQYLIRAEARANQGNVTGGMLDLNKVRVRAGLLPLAGLSQQQLIDSINQERRYELFTEFGDRWINLHRTGTADLVMPMVKGANWTTTDILYPIPQTERNRNPNLTQNAGY